MHTFFHGWRRKAGLVTLVMALALTGMWIRSHDVWIAIWFPCGSWHYCLISADGNLSWCSLNKTDFEQLLDDCMGGRYGFHGCGICTSLYRFGHEIPTIPHWFLVIPLTLLSAYLILWKPLKRA
ncbi:MAG: hypothetical protein JWP89_5042 [Schlesneria sp.]|nr:hypothetical protein [Schlesneria sp.]